LDDRIAEMETVYRSKQATGGIEADPQLIAELDQWYNLYC
jgi:hypothetical protein